MSEYIAVSDRLTKAICKECHGHGDCDDAEPGDTSYRTWECPACSGSGFKDGAVLVLEPCIRGVTR